MEMAMKIIFARFIKSYQVTLPDDYEILVAQKIVVQAKGEMPCILSTRN